MMITENIKSQIIEIWDKYVSDTKKVKDTKGNELVNIDERRIDAIETLKIIINDFLIGKIDLGEFKTDVDSFNKQNNYWGFTSIKGQMFFNLLVKTCENDDQQKKLTTILKGCVTEPTDLKDALKKIEILVKYTSNIFNIAPDKRKAPNPGSICYFLSYFWQIHNYKKWPIMYSSIITSFTDIGLWADQATYTESYNEFFKLNDEIKQLLSRHTKTSINNWDAEHAFWNFRTITAYPKQISKLKLPQEVVIQPDNNKTIYKASFNIFDYIVPAVSKLITYGNDTEKSSTSKGYLFEKTVADIFKLLDFEVQSLGQGKGREPDIIIKHREENTAFIVDAKAYSNGYGLSASDERAIKEYVFTHCPKLQKEGYKRIGFIIVCNSFKTDFETFINDITWNTDIKRFVLLESEALLHLLAYKIKDRITLFSLIESFVTFSNVITSQAIIQKFDDI